MRLYGHPNCRATPFELLVVNYISEHDEKPDQEFSRRGNFGNWLRASTRQSLIKRFEFTVVASRDVHRLSKQMSQHTTSGFADRTVAHLSGTRLLKRIESGVGDRLLARWKAIDVA